MVKFFGVEHLCRHLSCDFFLFFIRCCFVFAFFLVIFFEFWFRTCSTRQRSLFRLILFFVYDKSLHFSIWFHLYFLHYFVTMRNDKYFYFSSFLIDFSHNFNFSQVCLCFLPMRTSQDHITTKSCSLSLFVHFLICIWLGSALELSTICLQTHWLNTFEKRQNRRLYVHFDLLARWILNASLAPVELTLIRQYIRRFVVLAVYFLVAIDSCHCATVVFSIVFLSSRFRGDVRF